jgi:hypothetical protein
LQFLETRKGSPHMRIRCWCKGEKRKLNEDRKCRSRKEGTKTIMVFVDGGAW